MPFAAALSTASPTAAALDEVCAQAGASLGGRADLAVVFFSSHHVRHAADIAAAIEKRLNPGAAPITVDLSPAMSRPRRALRDMAGPAQANGRWTLPVLYLQEQPLQVFRPIAAVARSSRCWACSSLSVRRACVARGFAADSSAWRAPANV